jgi:hypothetical protein
MMMLGFWAFATTVWDSVRLLITVLFNTMTAVAGFASLR